MDISTLYKCFAECGKVTTDSRNCPEGSMFIALKGETFNGNAYAAQALEKGCRYVVIDEVKYVADGDSRILLVDDCLKALQELANYHRRKMGTRIIGITGTNGKTTTKELMAAVLQKRFEVLYTQGNLNNHIGVPLTLLRLTSRHELAVIEMGANHPGEIKALTRIVEPDYGIITNVGKAHLEGFGSFEGVIQTKGELYDYLRNNGEHLIFIDKDNEHLASVSQGLTHIGYGMEGGETLYVSGRLGSCTPFLSFEWKYKEEWLEVNTRLIGSYNMKNALAAIAVGLFFGVPSRMIGEALEAYVPHNNRSQLTETADNKLIVDAYNANPTSMMAALENFRLMDVAHKMVILGDMKELGEAAREEHQKIADYLAECKFDRVLLAGEEFGKVNLSYEHYKDVEALKEVLEKDKPKEYYILIKGSNSMKLAQLQDIL